MERDELFEIYDDTVVTIWDGHAWVDPAPLCRVRGRGAVVLTAWNPGWERPGRAVNDATNQRLEAELVQGRAEVWPAVGASRHDEHSEPGFIVWGMTAEEGCEIARRYGQFGIYLYDAEGQRVTVDCD
jgi:hypothetical protein